jgi:hypothetical protein
MLTLVLVLLGLVIVAAVGVAIKRRGNSGDPNHHGPETTGYEGGVTRYTTDTGGL